MEYVIGPVLGLLLGMKFTVYKFNQNMEKLTALEERIAAVDAHHTAVANEVPKKIAATLVPVARAVQKLNTQVGIG